MHSVTYFTYDISIHGCDQYHNAHEKRLKTKGIAIPGSRFIVDHITPLCDVASNVGKVMTTKMTIHAAFNIREVFVQKLIALKTTLFQNSGLMT